MNGEYPKDWRGTLEEVNGANYCARLLNHRPHWSKAMCQWFGEQVYKRYVHKDYHYADGFRDMAYVIAKTRD